MDGCFETRRKELEAECQVSRTLFYATANRLQQFMEPFINHYRRHEQARHAIQVVQGLCSDLQDKNGESIAYLFGLDRKAIQHFLGQSTWVDLPLRLELGRQIGCELGEADGVIAFDPSTFPKSGNQSVGVARQWCGRLGKIENCQVGVYLGYVTSKGHALVDTELFLPKEWTQDKARLIRAGVPQDRRRHRTRHELALELLERHGADLPHAWITGDDEMGRPADFRQKLREMSEQYLLAVPSNTTIRDREIPAPEYGGNGRPPKRPSTRVDHWLKERREDDWTKLEVRDGEKGPLTVEALKRQVETGKRSRPTAAEEVLVVIRYKDRDSRVLKTDYYLSNATVETSLKEFARAAKAEHRIEECFQRAKGQVGLADYEVRNWTGWHHHQTLCLLASWFLLVETRRAEKKDARHDIPASADRDRIDPQKRTQMRFTPERQLENRTTPASQSTVPLVSLETAQSIAS